ncbi:MAG TPA: DMT family transporter [Allosphingosinicella sp.]
MPPLQTAPEAAPPRLPDRLPHRPLRGALLLLAGLLLFACMDSTTKYLAERYDVPLIVAVRYAVNFLLMILLLAPVHGRRLVETRRTGLALLRALCLASASLLVGLALQRLPVAETTAITFLAPMLVVLIAGPALGERIGRVGWAAALGGFAGVLLVVRPGTGLDSMGAAFALAAVGANVGYQLLSRLLASTERTLALLFYTALVGAIGFGLAAPFFWGGPAPDALTTLLFLSLGLYGGLGHFLFTAAYRHAPASMLAPMTYSQLVWAGLLGWLVFRHVPDAVSAAGMAVIAASGLATALKPQRRQAEAAPEPG